MTSISIKRVGPIEEVHLEIKRINLFLGPQASGKSTIAKIISQAIWAEKNFLTTAEKFDFYNGLINFHNMDKGYFGNHGLEIVYESPWSIIQMAYEKGKREPKTRYRKKENSTLYHNVKVEYIPAERNFVASIPNIQKYSEIYNNTIGFLNDWYGAKAQYQRRNQFEITLPDLSFSYRYKENEQRDILRTSDGEEVSLQASSSGQQSLLPLLLVAYEVLRNVYQGEKIFSPSEIAHIKKNAPDSSAIIDLLGQMGRRSRTKEFEEELEKLWEKLGYKGDYGCTHLVIEEPEQNLYPSTQRGLLQHLVELLLKDKHRPSTLTITTHSPYILYALDICMLAGLAIQSGGQEQLKDTPYDSIAVSPADVGLWQVRKGRITSLQDPETRMLHGNSLNQELQTIHEQMYKLLQKMPLDNERTSVPPTE